MSIPNPSCGFYWNNALPANRFFASIGGMSEQQYLENEMNLDMLQGFGVDYFKPLTEGRILENTNWCYKDPSNKWRNPMGDIMTIGMIHPRDVCIYRIPLFYQNPGSCFVSNSAERPKCKSIDLTSGLASKLNIEFAVRKGSSLSDPSYYSVYAGNGDLPLSLSNGNGYVYDSVLASETSVLHIPDFLNQNGFALANGSSHPLAATASNWSLVQLEIPQQIRVNNIRCMYIAFVNDYIASKSCNLEIAWVSVQNIL